MDERVGDSGQRLAEGCDALTPDPVTLSLTVHGAIAAAALVGLWKLGGESKFGTEKVTDLQGLRPKILKRVVADLELQIRPVLLQPTATEPLEVNSSGQLTSSPAKLSVSGLEAFTNAVREFVKSNSKSLLDLREAGQLESRLNWSLSRLRDAAWTLFGISGSMCLLMVIGKFEWLELKAGWIHVSAFIASVLLLVFITILYRLILNAAGSVDRLKSSHADLP